MKILTHLTRRQFLQSIIGQDDDNDYCESGYVAGVIDGVAYIARYSHGSCYDTFDELLVNGVGDYSYSSPGDIRVDWKGSPEDLHAMAVRTADPVMPDRTANTGDCDYDHLLACYAQVLEHFTEKP